MTAQVGWGESITQFPEANFAAKAIIEGMAPNLIGKNPVETEALWRQNKQQAWWYGYHGGIASYATAAIDIALWDLKGKALNAASSTSSAAASTRSCRSSPPATATTSRSRRWRTRPPGGWRPATRASRPASASAAMPVSATSTTATSPTCKAMREGLGPKRMLMIDNGIAIKWDVTDAVRRAKAMEEYDLAWIEEPLGAWDPEGYANLRAKTTTRIAYGEREWTLEQFERVLATGTVDVIGVDPGRAEGITGFKKVTERCEFYRARPTPTPGRRRSSPRRASPSRSTRRRPSSSSSSRSATRCSTTW